MCSKYHFFFSQCENLSLPLCNLSDGDGFILSLLSAVPVFIKQLLFGVGNLACTLSGGVQTSMFKYSLMQQKLLPALPEVVSVPLQAHQYGASEGHDLLDPTCNWSGGENTKNPFCRILEISFARSTFPLWLGDNHWRFSLREDFQTIVKLRICSCFTLFSCSYEISGLQTAVEPEDLCVPGRERFSPLVY